MSPSLPSPAPAADPVALGLAELERDPRHDTVAADERARLVDLALAQGVEAARELAGTPREIAARLGVAVEEVDCDGGFGTVIVFADYTPRPPRVRLYRPALALVAAEVADDPADIFLAHELFHHWEALRPARSLGRQHRLRSLSEIAAGAFAQALLGLDYHPKRLDEAVKKARSHDRHPSS